MTLGTGQPRKRIAGTFDHRPGARNFFCQECGSYVTAAPGEDDPRRCTTPGCSYKGGFGKYAQRGPYVRERDR